jgi:lipoate-protein ligase A
MSEEWRLINLEVNDAFLNMAIDEALYRLRAQGKAPNTLRLYRWNPSAVSIGYFQILEQEVSIEVCKQFGVDIIRRLTGGGAVYHSYKGEITYSIIVNQTHPKIPADIIQSYEKLCQGLVLALRALHLPAEFKPINDIEVDGKKISGNAQTRRSGVVVQHGTLLLDTDIRTMFQLLKVPQKKISDKLVKSVEDRVTTIRREIGYVDADEVEQALIQGFTEALDVTFVPGKLSDEERHLAYQLKTEKYAQPRWTFQRPI